MVCCAIVGCANHDRHQKELGIQFHRFPKDKENMNVFYDFIFFVCILLLNTSTNAENLPQPQPRQDSGPDWKIVAMCSRLLLLSNSTRFGEGFLQYAKEVIKAFFTKYGVKRILFIPYASKDYDGYAAKAKIAFKDMGFDLESIHEKSDAVEAVKDAQGLFIGGGNTFLLLKTMYDNKLIDVIHKQVLEKGLPYMGASAGTNVATVSICTTNDMPIVYPPSFDALKLIPFNINPHYIEPDETSQHMGETRAKRIEEYHQVASYPVLGMMEGCILHVDGDQAVLKGLSKAKLFLKDKEPVWYKPGDDVSFLLKP